MRLLVKELSAMGMRVFPLLSTCARASGSIPESTLAINIIPGLIGVIMMVIASLMTSLTIAREWEKGSMEQLISTPIKVPE